MSSAVRRSVRKLASSVSRVSSFAAPVSAESTSSAGLRTLLFSKVPSSGIASALQQRGVAPARSFQTTAMSAMSKKCVLHLCIALSFSFQISELKNLFPALEGKRSAFALTRLRARLFSSSGSIFFPLFFSFFFLELTEEGVRLFVGSFFDFCGYFKNLEGAALLFLLLSRDQQLLKKKQWRGVC